MSSYRSKMIATSRFKVQRQTFFAEAMEETPRKLAKIKTEGEEPTSVDIVPTFARDRKVVHQFKLPQKSLSKLMKHCESKRKMFLKSITTHLFQPITHAYDLKIKISKHEKENIKKQLRNTISESPKETKRGSEFNEKMIRTTFNKIIKEIKQRNFIRRDDENQIIKNRAEAFGASIKGEKHNVNQDSIIFSQGIYIVCDGHGTNGKQISEFVSVTAHKFLQQAINEQKVDPNIIKQLIKKTEVELDLSGIDIAFSGCTFVALVLYENNLYSINIGDSRAILCQGLTVVELTTMHKPDHPIQRQRIQDCGGIIHPIEIGKDKYSGPNRIWAPGRNSWGPGLALSRAFGDKAARKYGVLSQPEIKSFHLSYQDDFIVMGSDGLFDYMKDSQISFFMRKKLKEESSMRQQIAMNLVEEAKRLSGTESDDISCIIILLCSPIQFESVKMGAVEGGRLIASGREGKLRFTMKISSEELESLRLIIAERSNYKYQYLCSVDRLEKFDDNTPNLFCENFNQVTIEYQPYDCILTDLASTFPLPQFEIEKIVYSVCSALIFLEQRKYRHGDVSARMICKGKFDWKLIDNYFINGGVTAYQKVLEGKEGFISPSQMDKIRHGFVRESPPIQESDDVFALGMTCLELMVGRPSSLCYKQSYIRFNEANFNDAIAIAANRYPQSFTAIVLGMLHMNQQKRITLKDIISQPEIARHSKKYSLRNYNGK